MNTETMNCFWYPKRTLVAERWRPVISRNIDKACGIEFARKSSHPKQIIENVRAQAADAKITLGIRDSALRAPPARVDQTQYTHRMNPWYAPQATKVQLAPCQRPPRIIVMSKLRYR